VESLGGRAPRVPDEARVALFIRAAFSGTLIMNGGYDLKTGSEAISNGSADLISFGRLFLANPDLPERFRKNSPLNEPDPDTYYAGEEKGYIDYPKLETSITA